MINIFVGRIENQRLKLQDPDKFNLAIIELDGKEVELSIGKKKKWRSGKSNAYLFGVVYRAISDKTGYETEELHEIMKAKFSKKRKMTVHGEETIFYKGTSGMEQEEFSEFIDKVIRFAAMELGVVVPEPNQVTTKNVSQHR